MGRVLTAVLFIEGQQRLGAHGILDSRRIKKRARATGDAQGLLDGRRRRCLIIRRQVRYRSIGSRRRRGRGRRVGEHHAVVVAHNEARARSRSCRGRDRPVLLTGATAQRVVLLGRIHLHLACVPRLVRLGLDVPGHALGVCHRVPAVGTQLADLTHRRARVRLHRLGPHLGQVPHVSRERVLGRVRVAVPPVLALAGRGLGAARAGSSRAVHAALAFGGLEHALQQLLIRRAVLLRGMHRLSLQTRIMPRFGQLRLRPTDVHRIGVKRPLRLLERIRFVHVTLLVGLTQAPPPLGDLLADFSHLHGRVGVLEPLAQFAIEEQEGIGRARHPHGGLSPFGGPVSISLLGFGMGGMGLFVERGLMELRWRNARRQDGERVVVRREVLVGRGIMEMGLLQWLVMKLRTVHYDAIQTRCLR